MGWRLSAQSMQPFPRAVRSLQRFFARRILYNFHRIDRSQVAVGQAVKHHRQRFDKRGQVLFPKLDRPPIVLWVILKTFAGGDQQKMGIVNRFFNIDKIVFPAMAKSFRGQCRVGGLFDGFHSGKD
jgi:hypothetical protein